ncbi:MAG TPA: MFS transporter [Chlamydiales bacterium]|nr:MFS transporter [Chlamydiales bacterium]
MNVNTFRDRSAGIIGNVLEHYDSALFGLLAPFIAPLFFAKQSPITALILTYAMLPLGFLARPLGSLFFGWIGDSFGRKQALFCSLSGMALATVSIGSLPTFQAIGIYAPIFLAILRMLQSFCAAGETTGGAIFVLEHTEASKRGFVSSFYDASSIAGILIASAFVAYMSSSGNLERDWRLLFWIGSATAVFGLFLRLKAKEGREFLETAVLKNGNWMQVIKENRQALLPIILASGFAYTTYSLAFTFMNGFIPLITPFSKSEVMKINTLLLAADMLLLPFFGFLANRIGKEKVMLAGAMCSILGAVPLFALLQNGTFGTVVFVRVAIIISGIAFAAPYYAWAMEQICPRHRCLILSLGGAIGSQLIGMPAPAICLWMYKIGGWSFMPGAYLMIIAMGAGFTVYRLKKLSFSTASKNLLENQDGR